MLEIPEAIIMAEQINKTLIGRKIMKVTAAASPHKFAWYFGDPQNYNDLLQGRTLEYASAYGGRVEATAQGAVIHVGDGVGLRYHAQGEQRPVKHQLMVEFDDGTALSATVAMYGGIWCFNEGEFDNIYSRVAKEKISPLSESFNYDYYMSLFDNKSAKMSAKAFLATEQRIPGLGNGVLQDILLNAKVHPKKKMNALTDSQKDAVFHSLKRTLTEMVDGGGRDTERDLFGCYGSYRTKLSKKTTLSLCLNCGGAVRKETYMGGSIYYCESCQVI